MKYRLAASVLLLLSVSFLQTNITGYLALFGVRPILPLTLMVVISLMRSPLQSAGMGLVLGLVMDILLGRTIGWNGMLYMAIAFLIASFSDKIYRERIVIRMTFSFAATLLIETMFFLIIFLLRGYESFPFLFVRVILPEAVYNGLFAIPLYKPLQKMYLFLDSKDRIKNRL